MSFTPGQPSGIYKIHFIRYVDETYPDSPLWADRLDIGISFSSDSNNTPFDPQEKFQDEIDSMAAALAPLGWVFSGGTVSMYDGGFTLTEE